MDLPASGALERLPEDVQQEYQRLFNQAKAEIHNVEGMSILHQMLLERFCLTYALTKSMERQWPIDMQRYNQLLQIWLKIGSDLLEKYQSIFKQGALADIFISKIMMIVAEEVADPEVLQRLRDRLETVSKEDAPTRA